MADVFLAASTYLLGTIGFAANITLIIAIVHCTPPSLRDYSKIMLASAIFDSMGLVAIMATSATIPEVSADWSCYIKYSGFCTVFGHETCFLCMGLQCQMYSISVMMLCYSFFYRYSLIDQVSSHYNRTVRKFVIPAIVIVNCPLTLLFYRVMLRGARKSILVTEYSDYSPAPQIIGVAYFKDAEGLITIFYTTLTSFGPFLIAIYLRHITIRRSRDLNNLMSNAKQKMHSVILKVLNIQLFLASFFFVGSTFFLIDLIDIPMLPNISILAIPLDNLQNVCTPIANLCIITPYRMFRTPLDD